MGLRATLPNLIPAWWSEFLIILRAQTLRLNATLQKTMLDRNYVSFGPQLLVRFLNRFQKGLVCLGEGVIGFRRLAVICPPNLVDFAHIQHVLILYDWGQSSKNNDTKAMPQNFGKLAKKQKPRHKGNGIMAIPEIQCTKSKI